MRWNWWKVGENEIGVSRLLEMKMSSEDEEVISEMTQMLERLDEEETQSGKCPSCGSPTSSQDMYCGTCGQQLRKPEKPKVIVRRITLT
jgi:uncharacterized OB-fold protein